MSREISSERGKSGSLCSWSVWCVRKSLGLLAYPGWMVESGCKRIHNSFYKCVTVVCPIINCFCGRGPLGTWGLIYRREQHWRVRRYDFMVEIDCLSNAGFRTKSFIITYIYTVHVSQVITSYHNWWRTLLAAWKIWSLIRWSLIDLSSDLRSTDWSSTYMQCFFLLSG